MVHVPRFRRILWESVEYTVRNPDNKQTNADENKTSPTEVIMWPVFEQYWK